ncbi:hypothetical protein SRHO_G00063390 [Serrasalmus rhombeus]
MRLSLRPRCWPAARASRMVGPERPVMMNLSGDTRDEGGGAQSPSSPDGRDSGAATFSVRGVRSPPLKPPVLLGAGSGERGVPAPAHRGLLLCQQARDHLTGCHLLLLKLVPVLFSVLEDNLQLPPASQVQVDQGFDGLLLCHGDSLGKAEGKAVE